MRVRWGYILVSVPVVGLAAAWAAMLALAAFGEHPMWRSEPLNLAEAAILRDRGEVARLLSIGTDPHATSLVRAGFHYQHAARLTPLDAAVLANRPEIARLLIDSGVSFDLDSWVRAWCAAADDQMRAVLKTVHPGEAEPVCATEDPVTGPVDRPGAQPGG